MDHIVEPLDVDPESFPCPRCNGSGCMTIPSSMFVRDGAIRVRCEDCNGSGYGPPPPSLDREISHCIQRLAAWAHRDIPKEES